MVVAWTMVTAVKVVRSWTLDPIIKLYCPGQRKGLKNFKNMFSKEENRSLGEKWC